MIPRIMETGNLLGRYAIAHREKTGWSTEIHAVPYDYEIAACTAEGFGFPAFARAPRAARLSPA